MGGVRGEQEVGVNQKTVKGQKTEVMASQETLAGKGADRWRLPPSGTTTLCDLTPPSGSRKASQLSPLGPPAAVVGPEVHPRIILCLLCEWLWTPGWSPGIVPGRWTLLSERGWQQRVEQETTQGPLPVLPGRRGGGSDSSPHPPSAKLYLIIMISGGRHPQPQAEHDKHSTAPSQQASFPTTHPCTGGSEG